MTLNRNGTKALAAEQIQEESVAVERDWSGANASVEETTESVASTAETDVTEESEEDLEEDSRTDAEAADPEELKTYDELTFADDFLFCKILQSHPDLCKELTELILGRKIGKIVKLNKQYPIEIDADSHGVRFDVYLEDDKNTAADIEMQAVSYPDLPRRSRYYQSMMDLESLERGVRYMKLPRNYVIFICLKAPFRDQELHKLSFRNVCRENDGLALNDGTEKIFLSAEGTADDISDDLKHFLEYLTDQKTESSLTTRLEDAVQRAKNRQDWSQEYMTLYEMKEIEREAGRKEGRKEGLQDGKKEGRANELIDLVCDGTITEEAAAERAEKKLGISRQKFLDRLAAARKKKEK